MDIRYTQNFLKSGQLIEELIYKARLDEDDDVIEIGTGKGKITRALAQKVKKITSIEKDPALAEKNSKEFANIKNIEIINEDFLEFQLPKERQYKIFSNIPFSITSEIVNKITRHSNPPTETFLIMQLEAAERFAGEPLSLYESQISLMIKPRFTIRIIYEFEKSDFEPMPGVKIVMMQISKKEFPDVKETDIFEYRDFINYSFNQWQSGIFKVWEKIFSYEQLKRLGKANKIRPDAKPTQLSYQQYLAVYNYFKIGVEKSKKQLIKRFSKNLNFKHKKRTPLKKSFTQVNPDASEQTESELV